MASFSGLFSLILANFEKSFVEKAPNYSPKLANKMWAPSDFRAIFRVDGKFAAPWSPNLLATLNVI